MVFCLTSLTYGVEMDIVLHLASLDLRRLCVYSNKCWLQLCRFLKGQTWVASRIYSRTHKVHSLVQPQSGLLKYGSPMVHIIMTINSLSIGFHCHDNH
ncbi:hypothetical protein HanIR_Chr11g0507351 [Helianthus annuus]|nr:hypothetical protein HanIR_Chr11g0507351 [Helianthus annuus]